MFKQIPLFGWLERGPYLTALKFAISFKTEGEKKSWYFLINVWYDSESLESALTLILLKWTKWWAPTSASKWRMEFNSAFKGLRIYLRY
jgi:hypothetical protein